MSSKPTYKFAKEHNKKKLTFNRKLITEQQLREKPYKSVIFF